MVPKRLGAELLAEFLGTLVLILFGNGVVARVVLFVGASIPMAEKRSLARRPHYAEHQQRVSMLIPWRKSAPAQSSTSATRPGHKAA